MMFFLLQTLLALPFLAVATPTELMKERSPTSLKLEERQFGSCAGCTLCCNSLSNSGDPATSQLLALLGINLSPGYGIGITCSPITAIGLGNSCSAQPLCCTWCAGYGGVVAIDCYPLSISL